MPVFHEDRIAQWLSGFETALGREAPFVIIADMEEFMSNPHETHEEKKAAALWMKRNLARVRRHFRGTVYVLKDDAARAALLESGRKQAKASGLPVEAAGTKAEAMDLARALLGDR